MRFPIISTIYKKEIKEVLRDTRMLFLVILMPFFLYPVLFLFMGKVGANSRDKINSEKVVVYVNPEAKDSPITGMLRQDTTLDLRFETLPQTRLDSMREKELALVIPAILNDTATLKSSSISIYGDDTEDVVANRRGRISGMINAFGTNIANERLQQRGLNEDFVNPVRIEQRNTASERASSGALMGRFIPMMLLLFVFVGCIYIAIDTTAGEKERRTLQTIYTTPVSTNEIIAGKFMAVATVGILSAFANLASLLVSVKIQAWMLGASTGSMLSLSLGGMDIVWVGVLIILATIFLAAISMAVVLLANSYKEAQSYVTPLMMAVLIPSIMAGMPGAELNVKTAMMPMYNICLAMSDIFKGTYSLSMIGLVAVFALIYGLIALWVAGRTFGNESVVTGEKVDFKGLFSGM